MNKLTFLRKPPKPMLIAMLLVLTSTATLVFCLQALLDALVMEHCMNSAAYVGTLYNWTQKYPMLKEIPADILQALADSDTVVDGTTFVTQGRELRAGDAGSRVCMISEAAASENGLVVGDTIQLSIAPGCYTYRSDDFEDLYGWNSGYPFEGDALLDYPEYGGFEIVGIYSEIGREVGRADYRHHTRNDIFIPGGILPASSAGAQARPVTFRVLGPDYQDFMNEFEVPLHEQGYALSLVDSGWETMSGSFYAMSDRRALMTAFAVLTAY